LRNEERRNRKVESNKIVVMGSVACIEEVWRRKGGKGKEKKIRKKWEQDFCQI
jgi:hypothetical protein